MYDETIKKILNIDDISKVRISENYLYNKLKDIGLEENIDISKGFLTRLKNRLYSWYVDSDFILLKFMCHRGSFREDINKECILCGYPENSIEHIVNDCKKLCRIRRKTLEELNKIDNTNYKKLLKAIEYHYYSKKYTNGKEEKKSDKRGVKIIKDFLLEMYKKFGAVKKKNDDE